MKDQFSSIMDEDSSSEKYILDPDKRGFRICGRRCNAWQILFGLLVLTLIIVVVALSIVIATRNSVALEATTVSHTSASTASGTSQASENQVTPSPGCLSAKCLQNVGTMLSYMNTSVDPCQDFYGYACGNWNIIHPLDPDQSASSIASVMAYTNREILFQILQSRPSRKVPFAAEQKLQDLFQSCMNVYRKDVLGGRPLITNVINKMGGWNVLDPNWDPNSWSWKAAFKSGYVDFTTPLFFNDIIRYNGVDADLRVVFGGVHFNAYQYGGSPETKMYLDYKAYIKTIAEFLVKDNEQILDESLKSKIATLVQDAFEMEELLAKIRKESTQRKEYLTLDDLSNHTNGMFDLLDLLQSKYGAHKVNESSIVITYSTDYFTRLINLTQGPDALRKLNNYMVWRVIDEYAYELSSNYLFAYRQLKNTEGKELKEYCLDDIASKMADVLGSVFIQDHFGEDNRNKLQLVINYTRNSLIKFVQQTTWTDQQTKDILVKKLRQMIDRLGYHDSYLDPANLDELYKNVTINESEYLMNIIELNRQLTKIEGNRIMNGYDDGGLTLILSTYSRLIVYMYQMNALLIPAGGLQPPVLDKDQPNYQNFAKGGVLVARAIISAMLPPGNNFKLDGSTGMIWSPETSVNYKNASACVFDYFFNMTLGPYTVNGVETFVYVTSTRQLTNWVKYLVMVKMAYFGYKDWLRDSTMEDMHVSGLNKTMDQLFFISYAQGKCAVRTDEAMYSYVRYGSLPESVMVQKSLAQMDEFRAAFNCPANSQMVADRKCNVF